jgi:hypothetical protein
VFCAPGEAAARELQRVERAGGGQRRAAQGGELGVDELHVEARVVDHEARVADEAEELFRERREGRLVGEKGRGEAVYGDRVLRDGTLGVDVAVVDAARRHVVDELHRTDLDDAVACGGVEAGGLGVEHDLTHGGSFRVSLAIRSRTAARAGSTPLSVAMT